MPQPEATARPDEPATPSFLYHEDLFRELAELLATGYRGQIVLHCNDGFVERWDHTPRKKYGGPRSKARLTSR